jgi:hypothetical protein
MVREYQYQYFDYNAMKKEVRSGLPRHCINVVDQKGSPEWTEVDRRR